MGETNYIFSAVLNGFLPLVWKKEKEAAGTWPDDAVEISYEDYLKFTTDAPEGKILGSVDGRPAWVDIPPPTKEELIAAAEAQKKYLVAEATTAIAPLQDAVDMKIATPDEMSVLKEWKTYRVMLNRVDTSSAPDIEWPVKP